MKEETIKKKTRQGLAALGAIVALIVVLSRGRVQPVTPSRPS